MDADFVMTYPCFTPLITPTEPFTQASADGTKQVAVVIFTDDDLRERSRKFNKSRGHRTLRDAEELAEYLDEQSGFTKGGIPITHVTIDPGDPTKLTRNYPIAEFVPHVLGSADAPEERGDSRPED